MKLLACLTTLLLLASPVAAADYDKGLVAAHRGDYATALREFRPLAERGNAWAQYNLGVLYENGKGVPQDYAAAVGWYRKAAEQGNAWAQHNLGFMYDSGHGLPQDYAAAVHWYSKAAEQNQAASQHSLGIMYVNGDGVPQDNVQAHKWFNLAATQGNENAIKDRDLVAKKMTPAQIAEAQKLAREWFAKRK